MSVRGIVLCLAVAGIVSGCGMFSGRDDVLGANDPDNQTRTNDPYHTDPDYATDPARVAYYRDGDVSNTHSQSLLSSIFGSGNKDNNNNNNNSNSGPGGAGVGVNSYLWRATLDTVSFMPLASADPFGGVIITDWYSPPDQPNERFKVNIFILGRELRADGVRASVFRQKLTGTQWTDAAVDQATGTDLENAILTRARQMRLSTASK